MKRRFCLCKRCNWKWVSIQARPVSCASCKAKLWWRKPRARREALHWTVAHRAWNLGEWAGECLARALDEIWTLPSGTTIAFALSHASPVQEEFMTTPQSPEESLRPGGFPPVSESVIWDWD